MCSDFLVADENAIVCRLDAPIFEAIEKRQKIGKNLLVGIQSDIIAIACHPEKPILAIAGDRGWVMLWHYMDKKRDFVGQSYENYSKDSRDMSKDGKSKAIQYSCMEFTPDGKQLLVATSAGTILIFDPETAKEIK